MSRRLRLTTALVCGLTAIAVLAPLTAQASPLFGIGDENAAVFSSPSFTGLGVKRVRLITPYNSALTYDRATVSWLVTALTGHKEVIVAFNPAAGSRCPAAPCKLPTAAEYAKAFTAFHKAFPSVKVFQPWNEVNSVTQPTARHPEAVVLYYSIVKKACPSCTVLGSDLLDTGAVGSYAKSLQNSNEASYARALLKAYKKAKVATPQLWGLHNYRDVNYHYSTGIRVAEAILPGKLWLTETGGLHDFAKTNIHLGDKGQANATKWLISLVLHNSRIARVYIYDMLYAKGIFDSALLNAKGQPRPAYYVLKAHYAGLFR